jgi:hypothetical protein
MSLFYPSQERADLRQRDYGFILALFCMVLALSLAIAIFKPRP